MATTKLNDLLAQVDEAYDYAQTTEAALAKASAARVTATNEAKAAFDAVVAKHDKAVADASVKHDEARQKLETLGAAVSERLGALTGRSDSRVSIK